jgi:hypothetical protein
MTALIVLNLLFALLIVGALAAVCRGAYGVAGRHVDVRGQPEPLSEADDELQLAA